MFCQLLHGARLSPGHSISAAPGGAADGEMLSMGWGKNKNPPKNSPKSAMLSGDGGARGDRLHWGLWWVGLMEKGLPGEPPPLAEGWTGPPEVSSNPNQDPA